MKLSHIFSVSAIGLLLGAVGCAAETGDPRGGESSPSTNDRASASPLAAPPASADEAHASVCIGGLGCVGQPPSPSVNASDYFDQVSFKAGPFNPGDTIVVGAWNGSAWTAQVTTTAAWTCPPGKTCYSWSYYATGSFTDTAWGCGSTEAVWAHDTTTGAWVGPVSVQNVCIQ